MKRLAALTAAALIDLGVAAYNFSAWLIAGLVLARFVDGKEALHTCVTSPDP